MWLSKWSIVNPYLISKMEALLKEFQGTRTKEFMMWIKFHNARIVIILDIRSMNVHLLKVMWGKDLLNINRI
jgi:hypothetical protein